MTMSWQPVAHTACASMISLAFSHVGMNLTWSGEDVDTIATDQNGVVRARTNPKFFRPAEVDLLIGDPALAEKELGWCQAPRLKNSFR